MVLPGPLLCQQAQPWPLVSIPGVFCSSSITLSTLALLSHTRGPAGDHMRGVTASQAGQEGHGEIYCLWFLVPAGEQPLHRCGGCQTTVTRYSSPAADSEPKLSFCARWAGGCCFRRGSVPLIPCVSLAWSLAAQLGPWPVPHPLS